MTVGAVRQAAVLHPLVHFAQEFESRKHGRGQHLSDVGRLPDGDELTVQVNHSTQVLRNLRSSVLC